MHLGEIMFRRRRRTREIPFSFDSFLDVVANVVGIIIRLILVVWVGARSYASIAHLPTKPHPNMDQVLAKETARFEDRIAQEKQDLEQAQSRLLDQLRRLDALRVSQRELDLHLGELSTSGAALAAQEADLRRQAGAHRASAQATFVSLADIRSRQRQVREEIRVLEQTPAPRKLLRFRTPVSRPLHSEEFFFECRAGRVTFINLAALLAEVRRDFEDKGKLLRDRWQVSDDTAPAGAFRMHYTIERTRGVADALVPGGAPPTDAGYGFGLSEWTVVPISPDRGETLATALSPKSEFRQIVDRLDPRQTAVTFWVYPDSFELFRRLRDFLYERELVVAGRPLPAGIPSTGSRRGSLSQGQ